MFTEIKNKDNNIIKIVTQNYLISTYVAIYLNKNIISMFTISISEELYHKNTRIKAIKSGETLIGGTIINCNSKYKINEFNKE